MVVAAKWICKQLSALGGTCILLLLLFPFYPPPPPPPFLFCVCTESIPAGNGSCPVFTIGDYGTADGSVTIPLLRELICQCDFSLMGGGGGGGRNKIVSVCSVSGNFDLPGSFTFIST